MTDKPRKSTQSSSLAVLELGAKASRVLAGVLMWLGVSGSGHAASINYLEAPLSFEPNSITTVVDGITVTATAYHVEFFDGGSRIFGPFSTGFVGRNQVFGPCARGLCDTGLGLYTRQDLGQTDPDVGSANFSPGFDNFAFPIAPGVTPLFSIQFALFSFSKPVDVSQVIVDDVSNFDRSIWAAGGPRQPALDLGLVEAFAGFIVLNSPDDLPSDGIFVHDFDALTNIRYLAIGTPIREEIGDQGPFAAFRRSQFYINGFSFSPTANGGSDPPTNSVPEPGSLLLMAIALPLLFGARARCWGNHSFKWLR